jgi:hypothetical protein
MAFNRDAIYAKDSTGSVTGLVDPTTGRLLGGVAKQLPYLQKANWCFIDTSNAAFASNYTQHIQMTVEAPFVAVQIGVVNGYTTGGSQTVQVAVSTMNAAGDPATTAPLNNAGTWVNAGNGGSALVVPAATVQGVAPGIAWGDIVPLASLARVDGGTFPLLCVRVQQPSGNNLTGMVGATNAGTPFEIENYSAAPYGRLYRARSQGVLGVTTISAMSTTSADQSYGPPIIVRYFLANGTGKTYTVFGDSIDCGYGQSSKNSWTWIREAAHQVSTQSSPVEICCLANSGHTIDHTRQRVAVLASACVGTAAMLPLNSPNSVGSGAISQATLNSISAQFAQAYNSLAAQGIPVITRTMFPTTTVAKGWGSSDSLRLAMNARVSTYGAYVINQAAAATSGVDGTGQQQLSPAEADGIHPAYGFASIGAPYLKPFL